MLGAPGGQGRPGLDTRGGGKLSCVERKPFAVNPLVVEALAGSQRTSILGPPKFTWLPYKPETGLFATSQS